MDRDHGGQQPNEPNEYADYETYLESVSPNPQKNPHVVASPLEILNP